MSKPYFVLREKMKPAARQKAVEKTKSLLDALPFNQFEDVAAKTQRKDSASSG